MNRNMEVRIVSSAFNLRLPPTLQGKLRELARENHRSLNAEIIHRLQRSLDGYRQ